MVRIVLKGGVLEKLDRRRFGFRSQLLEAEDGSGWRVVVTEEGESVLQSEYPHLDEVPLKGPAVRGWELKLPGVGYISRK